MIKIKNHFYKEMGETYIQLEDGTLLHDDEWNGEVYTIKEDGVERTYKPVDVCIGWDEDTKECNQWDTIGFEKY